MAIDFPNAPTVGQQFTDGDQTWEWDGVVWFITAPTTAPGFVPTTGGTMTGTLTIDGADLNVGGNASVGGGMTVSGQMTLGLTPSLASDAANKGYVDGQIATRQTQAQADARYLRLTGGTLSGQLNVEAPIIAGSEHIGLSLDHFGGNAIIDNLGNGVLRLSVRGNPYWQLDGAGNLTNQDGFLRVSRASTNLIELRNLVYSATESTTLGMLSSGQFFILPVSGAAYFLPGAGLADNPTPSTLDVLSRQQSDVLYVPTRGSNANGSWTRHPDGTQECWLKVLTVPYATAAACTATWTFPASFVDSDISLAATITASTDGTTISPAAVDCTPVISELGSTIARVQSATAATMGLSRINGMTDFQPGDQVYLSVRAKGRWK